MHIAASQLAALLGSWDEAEDQLTEAPPATRAARRDRCGSRRCTAARSCWRSTEGDSRRCGTRLDEAQRRMENEDEYSFYARDLYLPALRAEGDAAERARAGRDREAEDEAPQVRLPPCSRAWSRWWPLQASAALPGPRSLPTRPQRRLSSRASTAGPDPALWEAGRRRPTTADRQPGGGGLRTHAQGGGATRHRRRPRRRDRDAADRTRR